MNYPGLKKEYQKEKISFANRGMNLEKMVNQTNEYYLNHDIAVIYKKPTPIGISKVEYRKTTEVIKEAYFMSPSTLDYNGLYKGFYIDFDAKETQNKASFPLSNIHPHQIEHIKRVLHHGGICFLLIKMCSRYFCFRGNSLLEFLKENDRKSIPYSYIVENSIELKEGYNPPLPYIQALDLFIKEKLNEKEN